MKFPSLGYILSAYANTFRRFPVPVLTAVVATVFLMSFIEDDNNHTLFKAFLSCVMGFPMLIAIVVLKEVYVLENWKYWLLNAGAIALMIAFGIFWAPDAGGFSPIKVLRFFLLTAATHLLPTFVAYFKNKDVEHFWEFNRQLFINFAIGAIYGLILFAGLSAALLALENLFDVDLPNDIYAHLFVVIAGIFHTAYFLSNFPIAYENSFNETGFQRSVINLVKYVLIPLVSLYFLILYAFSAKILVTWTLPKGWVASLIIGFSVAGILTYLLNYMIPKYEDSSIVRQYRRWFFYVLLPMVALLFSAIFRRLSDYGVTEERYFVVLTGVWLTFISLYFIFSRKDDIRVIPISLVIFCLISAVGPWSAFSVSISSQQARLEALLVKNNILKDGKIVRHDPELASEEGSEINSIVYFFDEREALPEVFSAWMDVSNKISAKDFLAEMGVKEQLYYYSPINEERYSYYRQAQKVFDVSSAESFTPIQFYNSSELKEGKAFQIRPDGAAVLLNSDSSAVQTFELAPHLNSCIEKYGATNDKLAGEPIIIELENDSTLVKMIFEEMQIVKTEGRLRIESARGFAFWQKKE